MTDQLVSFETAKLAKEKGFNIYDRYMCSSDGNFRVPVIAPELNPSYISLPTQSLLQKWLRDMHGIKVISDTDITLAWIYSIQSLHPNAAYIGRYIISRNTYSTYEEALELGLYEALKLIP